MHRVLSVIAFASFLAAQDKSPLRLPAEVRPVRYQATLGITPGSDSFTGSIEIWLSVPKPVAEITLHAKELEFKSVSPTPLEIRKGANDLVTLVYDSPFPTGAAKLKIKYTGTISRVLTDGAFQQQHAGEWYVFTKFEPITARRVFPCFDEPGYKVPWQLSLSIPNALKAFSNTAELDEDSAGQGFKLVRFRETKPLPSYLVAFAVGPFDVVDTGLVGRRHVPSRIVVPKGRAAEAEYAAAITPKLVEMLEGYFGTPYPYEKLDQVVVPLTTAWGAMENAGMIAYGDFFLAPKSQDSEFRHEGLAVTMEHEMSHQWFGDLVTMQWWNDVWLNEAFASWISNKLVAAWHPEWRINERRAASTTVFRADSLTTARKIRQPIEAAGDIGGAFDGITYGKGQAIIAMFEHYVGEAAFERGVRRYLQAHAFANATSDDLLAALDQVAPRTHVGQAFGTYLNQVGFPVVSVTVDCGGKPEVRLTQARMMPLGSTARENSTWDVPVCLSWETGSKCVLLTKPADSFALPAKGCPAGVFADSGGAGYYAASYSNAGKLALQGTTDQAAFLRNARLLFASGLGNMQDELRAAAVTNEQDPMLLQQAASMLESVNEWVSADLRSTYAGRISELYGQRAHELGWHPRSGDSLEVKALRLELVPLVATQAGDAALANEARTLADGWLKDRTTLDAEMVSRVLSVAAWHGGRDLFEAMAAALRQTKVQRERAWIISGMASFRDASLAEAALQLIGAPGIDARETSALLFHSGPETRQIVWTYVQANFDKLNGMLPSARGVPFATRLPDAASDFCDVGHAEEVEAFFHPKLETLPGGPRSLARAVEGIRLCAAKADVSKRAVSAFLRP